MGSNELYEHICKKYPDIEYNGEDLRLENLHAKLITGMWSDKDNYPNIKFIADKMNLTERSIYKMAKKYGLKSRVYYIKTKQHDTTRIER